jgi:uncharacterized protein
LRYKIKDIPVEGLVVDQPLSAALLKEALDGLDADLGRTAAAVRLDVSRTHEDVFVRGKLSATLGLACASCLGPARVDVAAPINMIYRPEDEPGEPGIDDSEDPLADQEQGTHDRKELDLAPMLREQLILLVPMTVRCRDACKGLCATCGQNLNERDCGHRPTGAESPFAALKDLKLQQ